MKPHRNSIVKDREKAKHYKPRAILGDIRKPNLQFTSDLAQIAHNTRLVKKKMKQSGTKYSEGLN